MSENSSKKHSPNVNLYTSVKTSLEIDIITGVYQAGKRIPSIVQIASIYGVGKSTAHKVVDSLCDDGVIHLKKGVGYFVKPFVVTKLLTKHIEDCQTDMKSLIDYCLSIGVTKEDILKMIEAILNDC